MASVADASGTRTFTHSPDSLTLTDAIQFQDETFTLHEAYDAFGRSAGYTLSNSVGGVSSLIAGTAQGYDAFGRISEVSVDGIALPFQYGCMTGTDLQNALVMPNGVTRQTTYDAHRDLLASVTHTNAAGTVLARRTYDYDAAGRLAGRTQYRLGYAADRLDLFGYNPRSELTSAALGTNAYAYAFDPIGNRTTASELSASSVYRANALNQYTSISNFVPFEPPCEFVPVFDSDGNQTLLKTTTGLWHVTYNGENRPVCFSNDTAVIEMAYDYQGRRFEYKETVSGEPTRHERYLYRDYLQLAAFSLMHSSTNELTNFPLIHTLVWDPTEPVATRPLALQTPSGWFTYAFDQVKNVTELFDASGAFAAVYDYAPFGAVASAVGSAASLNPLTFSSEVADTALGLQYYNYRHLNTLDGRWTSRDTLQENGFSEFYLAGGPKIIQDLLFQAYQKLFLICYAMQKAGLWAESYEVMHEFRMIENEYQMLSRNHNELYNYVNNRVFDNIDNIGLNFGDDMAFAQCMLICAKFLECVPEISKKAVFQKIMEECIGSDDPWSYVPDPLHALTPPEMPPTWNFEHLKANWMTMLNTMQKAIEILKEKLPWKK